MASSDYILLGKLTKTSGFDGTVAIRLEEKFIENIPETESVFLVIDGRPVPFMVDASEYNGAGILKLSFTGYESDRKMSEFIGTEVLISSAGNDLSDDDEDLSSLIGYSVISSDNVIGVIAGFTDNNGQWLAGIHTAGDKELLIPFIEEFIISIDSLEKTISVDIPEGLLTIN